MARTVSLYFVSLILFAVIDFAWLGFVARGFYRDALGSLMAEKFNLAAAGAFYLLFPFGLVLFVLRGAEDWTSAAGYGALFGLFAYATYDLTNLATLRDFPVRMALVDLGWGTLLSGIVAAGAFVIVRWL